MNMKLRNLSKYAPAVGGAGALAPFASFAQADYSTLTTAVDFSDAGPLIIAVGAAMIGAYVIVKVVQIVKGAVKRA